MTDEWSQYATPSAPTQDEWSQYAVKPADPAQSGGKPFYDAIGANMTPEMKQEHPVLAGVHQTAKDVATIGEKAANGLTLGALDWGLKKGGIQPPNFDNTAPENKSGLNMMGDVANLGGANKALGVIGSKVVAPVAKGIAKAVPEGLKQTSYALMQSIVNQLPKEFKYGANAGRAMVKEGLQGDASDIAEQSSAKIKEIGTEGDRLASSSNKSMDNSNAMKIINDKISELQAKSPRSSAATITKLQNAKKDLLGVVEGKVKDPIAGEVHDMASEGMDTSNMTPKETLDLKRNFDDQTAWKGTAADDTIFNKTMQQARGKLKDNLNDAVPGMKEWNQRYADLAAANQAAMRRVTYDQAGVGMKNLLNNFVRGSVGMSALGAELTGHGELAGEILAGWGAKEVLGNPMVKSKVAQMLYGLSETDAKAILRAAPWVKNITPSKATPVDAELVDNRPQGLPSPPRQNIRPDRSLPSPKTAGQSSGPVIKQGLREDYQSPLPNKDTLPNTDFGNQIRYQMKYKENVPLHPSEAGREELSRIYPPAEKGNPNISSGDLEDFNNMKDWELSQNKGGINVSGGKQTGPERVVTGSPSGHSEAFKKVSGNSEKVGFDLLRRASAGEEMTPGEQLKIKMMIHDFRKNVKPKMG